MILAEYTDPDSGGAYTSVGSYDHTELGSMVTELGERVGVDVGTLIKAFGHHLGKVFAEKFPTFFNEVDNSIEFLKKIDNHIHVEVRKLYPDAELPVFSYDDSDPDEFHLEYQSVRGFADLAHGLIEKTCQYYQENFIIERNDSKEGDIFITRFVLRNAN